MKTRGFTLIEMVVSVGLFSIVMVIATSAYLNLINLDRQVRSTNDVVSNLNFAVDSMARSIRTGSNYSCSTYSSDPSSATNCWSAPSHIFSFKNDQGQIVTYILDTTTHRIGACLGTSSCTTSTATYFTDPRIIVDTLSFYAQGVNPGDAQTPQVIFVIHGTLATDSKHTPVSFSIQTSATQRGVDI